MFFPCLIFFQVAKIKVLLNKIECRDHLFRAGYKEVLTKFYNHVCLNPIEFSTGGFYTINYNLLASVRWMSNRDCSYYWMFISLQILTGVVSYQIILLQFYESWKLKSSLLKIQFNYLKDRTQKQLKKYLETNILWLYVSPVA